MVEYRQLEPSFLTNIVLKDVPGFTSSNLSFYDISSFIFTLFFVAIIAAAFWEYILAGVYRMEVSEGGIRKSKETFNRTTWGLFGIFALFLLIFAINKGLLTGDFGVVKAGPVAQVSTGITTAPISSVSKSGGSTKVCESKEAVITKLQSSGGICGGAVCTKLSGCNYSTYINLIDQAVEGDSQLKKMIIVTMCMESRANPSANNTNTKGSSVTYDCGLMQINQKTPCDAAILDPAENIRRGVALMKEKRQLSSQTYDNIPAETGPFSAYNCCASDTVPNSPSADCTTANGFPYPIPKWACPINPGDSSSNMCSVKSYVCELSACMNQL
jgi:hypothetical protein